MKISFDFDDCLDTNKVVQSICRIFMNGGYEIFILSNRDPYFANHDLKDWCRDFGIREENILLIGSERKVHHFIQNGINLHFDNSFEDVTEINDLFSESKEGQPAILANFNSLEVGNIYNYYVR